MFFEAKKDIRIPPLKHFWAEQQRMFSFYREKQVVFCTCYVYLMHHAIFNILISRCISFPIIREISTGPIYAQHFFCTCCKRYSVCSTLLKTESSTQRSTLGIKLVTANSFWILLFCFVMLLFYIVYMYIPIVFRFLSAWSYFNILCFKPFINLLCVILWFSCL